MLLPRLQPPLRAAIKSIGRHTGSGSQQLCINEAFAKLAIKPSTTVPGLKNARHAHHKAQGAVNKAKDGPGKRLGAKKSGEQYVIPGNIIFRQRGTHWFPGENCAMGRDHTIYATQCGYVKYYKDPERHPKRQYIGVTFERAQVLPLPRNSMRRRRLGMVAHAIEQQQPVAAEAAAAAEVEGQVDVRSDLVVNVEGAAPRVSVTPVPNAQRKARKGEEGRNLQLRPGYMYREANWEIGRAAERAKIKIPVFKPRDRWTAWRKRVVKKAASVERRGLSRKIR